MKEGNERKKDKNVWSSELKNELEEQKKKRCVK